MGRAIVEAGIARLTALGAQVIGLETMPRTIENIGFYSGLRFRPGHLTVSLARDLDGPGTTPALRLSDRDQARGARECRMLTEAVVPGRDYSREIALTLEHRLGDVTVLAEQERVIGFALWHTAPLAEGRAADELRVLKLVARDLEVFRRLLAALESHAWESGARRVALRCQTAHQAAYGALVDAGYRVHWTDLRMTLEGKGEQLPGEAVVFSNWEI